MFSSERFKFFNLVFGGIVCIFVVYGCGYVGCFSKRFDCIVFYWCFGFFCLFEKNRIVVRVRLYYKFLVWYLI